MLALFSRPCPLLARSADDILGYGSLLEEGLPCNLLGQALYFPDCTNGLSGLNKTCANEQFMTLQVAHRKLAEIYPNYFAAEIIGATQVGGGVEGAEVGNPNMAEFSPSYLYRGGGCIHANDEGYYHIFEALYDKFLQFHIH